MMKTIRNVYFLKIIEFGIAYAHSMLYFMKQLYAKERKKNISLKIWTKTVEISKRLIKREKENITSAWCYQSLYIIQPSNKIFLIKRNT